MNRIVAGCLYLLLSVYLFANEQVIRIAVTKNSHEKSISATLICKLLNEQSKEKICRVVMGKEPLKMLLQHQADFAIVRNDHVYNFQKNSAVDSLRSIAALHKVLLFYIAPQKSQSQCMHLENCREKKVHLAYQSENSQGFVELLADKLKLPSTTLIDLDDKALKEALKKDEVVGSLLLDRHPSGWITDLLRSTHMTLYQLDGKPYSQLVRQYPYLSKTRIDEQEYPFLEHSILTLSLKSILVTLKGQDEQKVKRVAHLILTHIKTFQKSSPLFAQMSKKTLLEELVIPQHRGAFKAFNED